MKQALFTGISSGLVIILVLLGNDSLIFAQNNSTVSSTQVVSSNSSDKLQTDSLKIIEVAPLDIGEHRGLFIVTPDQKMQLRIIGSVRYLVVYDNMELSSKNIFNTTQIPTGNQNQRLPNYFNGLDQTRLGFEVTRRTPDGDVFVNLETDFAGANGFRIRHAYGQYRRFLFGQTWSLFSQITALPATANFVGPTGAVVPRTPQIRYARLRPVFGMKLAVGLEYLIPDIRLPDSLAIKTFQLLPGVSARLDRNFDWGYLQISGIIPVLSARENQDKLVVKTGWGMAASTIINSWETGKWYLMAVGGKAITSFINNLGGNGYDLLIDPAGGSTSPFAFGGYLTYEHSWNKEIYSNLSYGLSRLEKISFMPEETFHWSYAIQFNTFWSAVEGAKVGGEIMWGKRVDKNKFSGDAFRVNLLFYYDF